MSINLKDKILPEHRYIKLSIEEDLIELLTGSKVKVTWWTS